MQDGNNKEDDLEKAFGSLGLGVVILFCDSVQEATSGHLNQDSG